MADELPDEVLDALEEVREGGLTNMLDRPVVISLVHSGAAEDWLDANRPRYMEALMAMGERRAEEAV